MANKFYQFKITKEMFEKSKALARRQGRSHFFKAALFGFILETIFIKKGTYDSIVKKSTIRRCDYKRLEDLKISHNVK